MDIEVITRGMDLLGECPAWLADERKLLRVDITGQVVISRDVTTGAERRWAVQGPVGFALPGARGGVVAGVGRGLHVLTEDGTTRLMGCVEPDAIGFDLDRGRLGARRAFASIDPDDGLPDGLAVDAEGGVWVALFGGSAIRRYRPDGRHDAEVRLPVTNPTSLAFGGTDLDDLYITSAKHRLSAAQLEREPLAGSLLRARPGVRGLLSHRFGDG